MNDFGGARDGTGGSSDAAERVVEEIRAAGGEAMADAANVTDFEQVRSEQTDRFVRMAAAGQGIEL